MCVYVCVCVCNDFTADVVYRLIKPQQTKRSTGSMDIMMGKTESLHVLQHQEWERENDLWQKPKVKVRTGTLIWYTPQKYAIIYACTQATIGIGKECNTNWTSFTKWKVFRRT